MHSELKRFFRAELQAAHEAEKRGDFQSAFTHLERAHILSQKADEGLRVERGKLRVQSRCPVVIQQKPHPHTPIRRAAQGIQQKRAGQVIVPNVILRINRGDSRIGQKDTRRKSIRPLLQRCDTRLPAMCLFCANKASASAPSVDGGNACVS